jgi:hypothetical protein
LFGWLDWGLVGVLLVTLSVERGLDLVEEIVVEAGVEVGVEICHINN